MKLKWKVNDITGEKELERINHIILDINEKIERALGFIDLEPSEGMFFNGYQTWTLSREYVRNDRMRGLNGMPEGVIKRYSLEGYSDYHIPSDPASSTAILTATSETGTGISFLVLWMKGRDIRSSDTTSKNPDSRSYATQKDSYLRGVSTR